MHVCTCRTELLCYTEKIITTLLINNSSMKNFKKLTTNKSHMGDKEESPLLPVLRPPLWNPRRMKDTPPILPLTAAQSPNI